MLACLILGGHLPLKITRLIQAIQTPPAWLLGKDSKGGIQHQVGGDLMICKFSPNTGI